MRKALNVQRIVLPNGDCMTIEGGDAQGTAAHVINNLGGKVQPVSPPQAKAELIHLSSPPITINAPELTISAITPLHLPSALDGPKDDGTGVWRRSPAFAADAAITPLPPPPEMVFEDSQRKPTENRRANPPSIPDANGITPLQLPTMEF